MRTITEILIEADASTELKDLERLWKEVANNKTSYPITQLEFAEEHFVHLVKQMALKDLEELTRQINGK